MSPWIAWCAHSCRHSISSICAVASLPHTCAGLSLRGGDWARPPFFHTLTCKEDAACLSVLHPCVSHTLHLCYAYFLPRQALSLLFPESCNFEIVAAEPLRRNDSATRALSNSFVLQMESSTAKRLEISTAMCGQQAH